MTPTQIARRSDALYADGTCGMTRRVLCDMVAQRESDLEDVMAENARLRELVRDMCKAFIHGPCYRWCEHMPEPCNGDKCQYVRRMHELGEDA